MKQKTARLLALALAAGVALAGCGASAPAQSAASQSTPAATPAQSQAADAPDASAQPGGSGYTAKGLRVAMGETVQADLDGDGTPEEIRYAVNVDSSGWPDEEQPIAAFAVNDVDYAAQLPEMDAWINFPVTDCYYITDLDTTDGMQEIALMDQGPSDDPTTWFFRYDGQTLRLLGVVSDYITSDTFALDGAGTVTAAGRLDVLQTWWAIFTWQLSGDTLAAVPQQSYTPLPMAWDDEEMVVTLAQNLKVYAEKDAASATEVWLPTDEAVTFLSTDNVAWVEVQRGSQHGWIHLMGFAELDNDGLTDADQVFRGLFFAD